MGYSLVASNATPHESALARGYIPGRWVITITRGVSTICPFHAPTAYAMQAHCEGPFMMLLGVNEGVRKRDPRYANGARRRKVRAQVLAEETHCGICGKTVDKSLSFIPGKHSRRCIRQGCSGCVPDPMRAEVDEILPVSLGGSPYERSNCRLAHRECNRRRGNGMPRPTRAEIRRKQFPISREW